MRYISLLFCAIALLISTGFSAETPYLQTQASQAALTPEMAILKLKAGNARFIADKRRAYQHLYHAEITSTIGQFPFAIILNCIDSRSISNITLDQGLGNIFTSATAGNVVDTNILGGMEYATKHAGSKLIVIMGHTQCGAIEAACKGGVYSSNLQALLAHIQPAISTLQKNQTTLDCKDPNTINAIAKQNVLNQMQTTINNSTAIQALLNAHTIMLVGAMHNIRTGEIQFFDKTGKNIPVGRTKAPV